jgi:hypothetical protein
MHRTTAKVKPEIVLCCEFSQQSNRVLVLLKTKVTDEKTYSGIGLCIKVDRSPDGRLILLTRASVITDNNSGPESG